MHIVTSGQRVRIVGVEVAVDADTRHSDLADCLSGALTENGITNPDSPILDWRYTPWSERVVVASPEPEEGEVFQLYAGQGGIPLGHKKPSLLDLPLWFLNRPDSFELIVMAANSYETAAETRAALLTCCQDRFVIALAGTDHHDFEFLGFPDVESVHKGLDYAGDFRRPVLLCYDQQEKREYKVEYKARLSL